MSRLFEIRDSKGSRHCSENDLPLVIGTSPDSHILLEYGQEIEGYIDDSNGHLFFQPADSASQIFHNNQLITSSTWIKSDDTTRLGKSFLHYYISGDLVEIQVSTNTQQTLDYIPRYRNIFSLPANLCRSRSRRLAIHYFKHRSNPRRGNSNLLLLLYFPCLWPAFRVLQWCCSRSISLLSYNLVDCLFLWLVR